ncbi:hypothetical protein D3C80_407630 [compost metagenome]
MWEADADDRTIQLIPYPRSLLDNRITEESVPEFDGGQVRRVEEMCGTTKLLCRLTNELVDLEVSSRLLQTSIQSDSAHVGNARQSRLDNFPYGSAPTNANCRTFREILLLQQVAQRGRQRGQHAGRGGIDYRSSLEAESLHELTGDFFWNDQVHHFNSYNSKCSRPREETRHGCSGDA